MMNMAQILSEIRSLANSQGYYGRLYEQIKDLEASNPEGYEKFSKELEAEGFETTLDIVLYFEEGKHCKRKFWKIPVTWECYGVVEVEGNTIEEAIANFHKKEDSDSPFALPEANYVDGSFKLSDDDEEELIEEIRLMNKEN